MARIYYRKTEFGDGVVARIVGVHDWGEGDTREEARACLRETAETSAEFFTECADKLSPVQRKEQVARLKVLGELGWKLPAGAAAPST